VVARQVCLEGTNIFDDYTFELLLNYRNQSSIIRSNFSIELQDSVVVGSRRTVSFLLYDIGKETASQPQLYSPPTPTLLSSSATFSLKLQVYGVSLRWSQQHDQTNPNIRAVRQAHAFGCCKRVVRSDCEDHVKTLTTRTERKMEQRRSPKVGWGMLMSGTGRM
jgi:hypothetical protein